MFLRRSLVKNFVKNKLSAAKLQPLTNFVKGCSLAAESLTKFLTREHLKNIYIMNPGYSSIFKLINVKQTSTIFATR